MEPPRRPAPPSFALTTVAAGLYNARLEGEWSTRTTIASWVSIATPTRRRSSAPIGDWPYSTTPTRIPATTRPKNASKRSMKPTMCSATPPLAASRTSWTPRIRPGSSAALPAGSTGRSGWVRPRAECASKWGTWTACSEAGFPASFRPSSAGWPAPAPPPPEGAALHVEVEVDVYTAVLSGEVRVPTPAGPVVLKIPAGSQPGQSIRLKGRGMPSLHKPSQKGDLFARLKVTLPTDLSDEEKALFEQLAVKLGKPT